MRVILNDFYKFFRGLHTNFGLLITFQISLVSIMLSLVTIGVHLVLLKRRITFCYNLRAAMEQQVEIQALSNAALRACINEHEKARSFWTWLQQEDHFQSFFFDTAVSLSGLLVVIGLFWLGNVALVKVVSTLKGTSTDCVEPPLVKPHFDIIPSVLRNTRDLVTKSKTVVVPPTARSGHELIYLSDKGMRDYPVTLFYKNGVIEQVMVTLKKGQTISLEQVLSCFRNHECRYISAKVMQDLTNPEGMLKKHPDLTISVAYLRTLIKLLKKSAEYYTSVVDMVLFFLTKPF